jgi:hypothetical protein
VRTSAGAILALATVALGCPGRPKAVVYDLAARAAVAETWSAADVLRFGTPAAEPRLTEGFHREAGGSEEPFLWSKAEAEVAFLWESAEPRLAILDAMPFKGVSGQSLEVRLNGTAVERFALNDARHRYRIVLPAAPQRAGDNRLRFVCAKTASPPTPTRRASIGASSGRRSTASSPAPLPTRRSRTCSDETLRALSSPASRRAFRR